MVNSTYAIMTHLKFGMCVLCQNWRHDIDILICVGTTPIFPCVGLQKSIDAVNSRIDNMEGNIRDLQTQIVTSDTCSRL